MAVSLWLDGASAIERRCCVLPPAPGSSCDRDHENAECGKPLQINVPQAHRGPPPSIIGDTSCARTMEHGGSRQNRDTHMAKQALTNAAVPAPRSAALKR